MKTLSEVIADTDAKYPRISLSKLVGKKIKDLEGRVSIEFGDPVFKVYCVVFEDGVTEYMEGEHDIAYLPSLSDVDSEQLMALRE